MRPILLTFTTALSCLALIGPANSAQPIEQAIAIVIDTLPAAWRLVETKQNQYPYGHHFCGGYDGLKGTKLTIVGPNSVSVQWTTESGEERVSKVAVESIELWFMPANYKDASFAWLCFHRPVQPVQVFTSSRIRVFGRTSHRLDPPDAFARDILPKASSIRWPDSPANNPSLISWQQWSKDIATALAAAP